MDGKRFDQLAKSIAAGTSRRRLLRGLGATALGGFVGLRSRRGDSVAQDADRRPAAAFAPYWYVDDETDSFIDVKNFGDEPLELAPVLTLSDERTVALDPVAVPPHATARLDLKSSPRLAAHRQRAPGSATGQQRWGDGSRPHSLLGSAELRPSSSASTTAGSFAAQVVVANHAKGLGFPITFEHPGNALTTGLEGVWWLPFPETQAYVALRNTSRRSLTGSLTLYGEGKPLIQQEVTLDASAMTLVSIRDVLAPAEAPEAGGIRFRFGAASGEVLAGDVVGRSVIVHEEQGLSSTLAMTEPPDPSASDAPAELPMTAVYLGNLARLESDASLVMDPHLLMRNMSGRDLAAEPLVYGQDGDGNRMSFAVPSRVLTPEAPLVVDLEAERRASTSDLAGGMAGLRVPRDGDTATFAVQGDCWVHSTSRESSPPGGISFDLEQDSRSFILLRNVTEDAQQARVVLDYDGGRGRYDVQLPEIPPQHVQVVDVKRLRDEGIPARNGELLPPDVEFGGVVVAGDPGTVASSRLVIRAGNSIVITWGDAAFYGCLDDVFAPPIDWSPPGGGGGGGSGGDDEGEDEEPSLEPDDDYTEDPNPDLMNPERGMYFQAYPGEATIPNPDDPGGPQIPDPRRQSHTIVVPRWLHLDEVCDQELTWNSDDPTLSSDVLTKYAEELQTARDKGVKVLFRPRYDKRTPEGEVSHCGLYHAKGVELQKRHITAVAAMLSDYKDVIAAIQAGYLGKWGEWNLEGGSSTVPLLMNPSDRQSIATHILTAYHDAGIKQHVEFRRPMFAREALACTGNKVKELARVGLHNDCFMSTDFDLGTYFNFCDESIGLECCEPSDDLEPCEASNPDFCANDPDCAQFPSCPPFQSTTLAKEWAQWFTANASFGGETCPIKDAEGFSNGTERWQVCADMISPTGDPATLHMNYLNGDFVGDKCRPSGNDGGQCLAGDVIVPGAVTTWMSGGCYDEIRRNLGYRFVVRSVEYTRTVAADQWITVNVVVENTGWGRLHKPRYAILVLRDGDVWHEYPFNSGAAYMWAPGQPTTISVHYPAPPAGTYEVRLWIPDPNVVDPADPTVVDRDAPQQIPYAVKLATLRGGTNVFDGTTGENNLGVTIKVQ